MTNAALPAERRETDIGAIDRLAQEARIYRATIDLNMWQLARVFTEAKELVPHGAWGAWLAENAQVSERTAQDMMAAYRRFGENPKLNRIGQSKAFKLLPLPQGAEDAFLERHDVQSMSTREIQEAVKRARAEAQAEIDREKEKRILAEKRAELAESREPEIPAEITEELDAARERAREAEENARHFADLARKIGGEKTALERENREIRADNKELGQLIQEQQEDIDRAQAELLAIKSAAARGDAERTIPDSLSPDAFAAAVRAFIGACCRVPQMRGAFAAMDPDARSEYDELLRTMEDWCRGARNALDTVAVEGTVL